MDWQNVALGDHIQLFGGGTPNKSIEKYWNGDIPWASVKDLKHDYLSSTEDSITVEGVQNSATRIVPKDQLIIATRMAVGKVAITNIDVAINQDLKTIICNGSIDKKYLFYVLKSKEQYFNKVSSGATVKGIKLEHIAKLRIPLPPLPEQKQIAAILDAADAYRQKTKALIEKYDQLTQSLFLEMFGDPVRNEKGWETISLSEVAKIIMGQSPPGYSYNEEGDGVPLLNGPTEFGDKYPIEKQWTIEPKKFAEMGDILFCVRGATAGRQNWSDKRYCIGRGLAAIRVNDRISKEFVYMYLERMYDIFQMTSDGSTFININKQRLENLQIPLTSYDFSQEFSRRIINIDKQKEMVKQAFMKSEELFQSLLQRAFKGELHG